MALHQTLLLLKLGRAGYVVFRETDPTCPWEHLLEVPKPHFLCLRHEDSKLGFSARKHRELPGKRSL
jgi:hypothetical protein